MSLKNLIFDTSTINRLAQDKDGTAILQSLGFTYRVGIPETVVSEVIADLDEERRSTRLTVFNRLLNYGNCIKPFNWIIEEHAKAYQRDPSNYDWRKLKIILRTLEDELARPGVMHSLGKDTLDSQRESEDQFAAIFKDARPAFQKVFETGAQRPTVREIAERLLSEGGTYLTIGANFIERAAKKRPSEQETKNLMERCPPLKALLVALCVAQYDRCVRGEREPWTGKAGWTDMLSAVYLPYCQIYVTSDTGQRKALAKVAELAGIDISIKLYQEFRQDFIGLAV